MINKKNNNKILKIFTIKIIILLLVFLVYYFPINLCFAETGAGADYLEGKSTSELSDAEYTAQEIQKGNEAYSKSLAEAQKNDASSLKGKNELMNKIYWFMGVVIYGIAYCVGMLTTWMLGFLTEVAQYNNFINATAVTVGWVVVRDICNMFFVLILLVIAFGTILRRESYSVKALLPKLVIMAVLINFSKTICGLIIDFSQVIMLTFVAGFANGSAGNMVKNLGMDKILGFGRGTEESLWKIEKNLSLEAVGGLFLGLICMIVILVIIIAMIVTLIARIVMLWIYTIMSPIAYFGAAFPAGQKYASQWWSEFSKNVIVGPVLAFFLYLAIVTSSKSAAIITNEVKTPASMEKFSMSSFLNGSTFSTYLITLGLLIGGMMVAQSVGASSGGAIGRGMAALNKGKGLAWKGIKGGTKGVTSYGVDKLHQKTGVDLNVARVWKGIQEKRQERKNERYNEGQQKAAEVMATKGRVWGALAMTGTPGTGWEEVTSIKGIKQRLKGGARMTADREAAEREEARLSEQRKNVITKQEFADKENEYLNLGTKMNELTSEINKANKSLSNTTDLKEIEKHQATIDSLSKKFDDTRDQRNSMGTELDKYRHSLDGRSVDDFRAKSFDARIKEQQETAAKNIPIYDFEARAAEQKVVNEKAGKIKDVKDADELLRILQEAIEEKDKAMIKAISKKMASNGDDNEFLLPLSGRTDAKGIQNFSRMLIDKAGFGKQEAFNLGSELSMIAKGTNHWAATGAYKIKNGMWQETNEKEYSAYRTNEVGKIHIQKIVRDINRLGYGYHYDENGKKGYNIDAGGALMLKLLDSKQGYDEILKNMNESVAKYMWANKEQMDKLVANGTITQQLVDKIGERARSTISSNDYENAYNKAHVALN